MTCMVIIAVAGF